MKYILLNKSKAQKEDKKTDMIQDVGALWDASTCDLGVQCLNGWMEVSVWVFSMERSPEAQGTRLGWHNLEAMPSTTMVIRIIQGISLSLGILNNVMDSLQESLKKWEVRAPETPVYKVEMRRDFLVPYVFGFRAMCAGCTSSSLAENSMRATGPLRALPLTSRARAAKQW